MINKTISELKKLYKNNPNDKTNTLKLINELKRKNKIKELENLFKDIFESNYDYDYIEEYINYIENKNNNNEIKNIIINSLKQENNEENISQETLYISRKIICYAILEDYNMAFKLLDEIRKRPLCRQCTYHSCKDSDIYEIYIYELMGDKQKALELAKKYKEKWPDELDFKEAIKRIENE